MHEIQFSSLYPTRKNPLLQSPASQVRGYKVLSRDLALTLIQVLFQQVGFDRLRADSRFCNLTFEDPASLDNGDLADAICVGLGIIAANASSASPSINNLITQRLAAVLGPLDAPIAYSVQGHTRTWTPPENVH